MPRPRVGAARRYKREPIGRRGRRRRRIVGHGDMRRAGPGRRDGRDLRIGIDRVARRVAGAEFDARRPGCAREARSRNPHRRPARRGTARRTDRTHRRRRDIGEQAVGGVCAARRRHHNARRSRRMRARRRGNRGRVDDGHVGRRRAADRHRRRAGETRPGNGHSRPACRDQRLLDRSTHRRPYIGEQAVGGVCAARRRHHNARRSAACAPLSSR